jgi:ParB family transcriptional regulator, chromosome partitioning protein
MVDTKKKKGLGRGLMSLFGDQEISVPKVDVKTDYLSISISNLVANKFQPRTYFDKEKIEELAQSIRQNGLIQPIIVRPHSEEGVYEIIAGERRCMAAQNAGLHEVPVVVLKINDVQALELAIVENIQREDLNVIEEAKGYDRLMKEFSYDHEKLADFMGKSRSHISNTLRLLTLPEEVIKMVDEGKLTAGQVRPLVGRYNAREIANSILKEKLSARSVENLVKNQKDAEGKKVTSKSKTDPNVSLAQRQIEESLGLKTKVVSRKNNSGKIIVEFNNLEQFEMLSKRLIKK